ncbi:MULTISPECIES: adenylosuccinate lyase [unclassified Methanoregula]|uniref:adenylosuccinate lyase n=1 Tax=unclassified Methanoregula TaxID=2649730 RepID=UPI0009C61E9E|nr:MULTISPECIES: adenylosuccinate lyase [unclassified Methanoregula]OPX62906.1 MAG: adenylosuccinate lyase [Methanoregula sp. PtaB.Bin085]OPY35119.1 MAG: adenylosuccinate lyase [Methanoregula sp. PtaU1.Bin006]
MPVHPIEERYGTKEMRAVWSEQNRFSCIVRAEVALAKAEAVCGMIPPTAALEIEEKAPAASLERAKQIEAEISHDMMAIVRAISEVCGESGRWVHYGATSNDILDTATGLQLAQALDLLDAKLRKLLAVLLKRADETKTLVCIGRTHGQHGVPTTYGLRFAIWAGEVGRHIERLGQLRPRVVVGQMTGAVGTQAAMGAKGMEVQAAMMEYLGIGSVDVSNQVISRDRYAEYFMFCAGVATTLDKIGVEIRSLQRTEIGEVEEAFGAKQVGSSTMPHKRNPIKSEQVCGLARIIRSAVEPALQNNTLWDERDLTNSSCERVLFPEASILTDHCLRLMAGVLEGLVINRAAIRRNLAFLHGINMAEPVMIELTRKGMNRQDAHEAVRLASMQALAEGKPLADVLATDPEVIRFCSKNDIAALLNPDAYIGTAVQQVERVIGKLSPMCPE